MQLDLDTNANTPVFQQIVDQIHFAINTGKLAPGTKLPSIRALASDHGVAANTVAKAFRQLEFRCVIEAKDRSGYLVKAANVSRYQARGVSSDKTEVHSVVDQLDSGAVPGAFCKITEDFLSGDPEKCNVIHSDGSGTKSIIAYLHYKETGDASVFHGIAQDSIVMNLDDLLCIGVNGRILFSNTVNRNALNCPGEIISALIDGSEAFMATMRDNGVEVYSGGGETADVGDLTGTVVVDSCAVVTMKKADVIANAITPGLAIVGLSSTGQANFESTENSGIGSNGLTSARHDMLCHDYAEKYPESFDSNVQQDLVYCGPYHLGDPLPGSQLTVGEALLSPTRSYAPVIQTLVKELGSEIKGLIHCSGGAQTKCLKFGTGTHYIKENLFPVPPVFSAIQQASGTHWNEMYKVFNMGHRMEIYLHPSQVDTVISVANSFNITAQQIGYTEPAEHNHLWLTDTNGDQQTYQ
ncbi:MAG: GntR family transcriptional regulator [Pseudomonadales bacterium]|nr:GntR family transcriptional regulator [Pseudomonadales bacterium]